MADRMLEVLMAGVSTRKYGCVIGEMADTVDWLTWAMSALATLLRATWFITSSDVITESAPCLAWATPPPPPPAFSRRLGTRGGSGGCRAVRA